MSSLLFVAVPEPQPVVDVILSAAPSVSTGNNTACAPVLERDVAVKENIKPNGRNQ